MDGPAALDGRHDVPLAGLDRLGDPADLYVPGGAGRLEDRDLLAARAPVRPALYRQGQFVVDDHGPTVRHQRAGWPGSGDLGVLRPRIGVVGRLAPTLHHRQAGLMTLVDDLRATAVDHAAIAVSQALAGGAGIEPERLARAAVAAAAPLLVDAERVARALAAREPVDRAEQRVAPLPSQLWTRSGHDETRYLELMEQHGWLHLATIRADGGPAAG